MIKVRVHYEMQDWEVTRIKRGYIDLEIDECYSGLANGSLFGMTKILNIVEKMAELQRYDPKLTGIVKVEKI